MERCNLRCLHCYQEGRQFKELDAKKLLEIAHILESTLVKWNRSGRVSLTGGEPFLRKDLLLKLLEFFETSTAFYWTGILTNGTLIDETIADQLKKFSKLKEIQVSLDGANAEIHDSLRGEGSFSKSVEALKLLKDKGFNVSIMFTLHKQNRGEAIKIIDLAELLKIDFLTIERMVPQSKEDMEKFYLEPGELKQVYEAVYNRKIEIEKRGSLKIRVSRPLWGLIDEKIGGFCPAGFSSIAILHDGTVLPCRRLEIPIGNILDDGLYKIWYTSDMLWKLRNKKLVGEKCGACELLGNCGGCRAIAYSVTGDFNAADPQCWKEKIESTNRR
ncbi:MAG: radical SAM protein [Candidatus Aminicenantes bacterium]|nr:radical SAM protein [Candidatus Aminicenantes bacterium]